MEPNAGPLCRHLPTKLAEEEQVRKGAVLLCPSSAHPAPSCLLKDQTGTTHWGLDFSLEGALKDNGLCFLHPLRPTQHFHPETRVVPAPTLLSAQAPGRSCQPSAYLPLPPSQLVKVSWVPPSSLQGHVSPSGGPPPRLVVTALPVPSPTWTRHAGATQAPQVPLLSDPRLQLPLLIGPGPQGIFTEMPLSRTTQIE